MKNQSIFALVVVMVVFGFHIGQVEATDITFTEDGVIREPNIYDNVYILNDATVDMTGGTVGDIVLRDQSTLNLSGGAVGRRIYADDLSTVNIEGGSLHSLWVSDSSTVDITGGSLVGWSTLYMSGQSIVNIYDVEMMEVDKFMDGYSSVMNIYGGKISVNSVYISSKVNIFGGSITFDRALFREDNLFIYGYDFNYDPNSYIFNGSLLYGGQITIHDIYPYSYEFLNLVVPEQRIINLVRTIVEKDKMLEAIDEMVGKEQETYEELEVLLESGDYGDLSKADIIKAKQRIHSAMQQQEQSADVLEKSIEKLEDAVAALGWETLVDEPVEE